MRAPLWAETGIKVVAQMEDAMTYRINSQIEHIRLFKGYYRIPAP
jgi:hypothetical protein